MMHLFRKKRPASVPGASSQSEIRTVPLGYTPEFMLPDTLEASVSSVIGTRQEQQDSLCLRPVDAGVAAVVCDGMGGLQNGQLASRAAADTFLETVAHAPAESLPDVFAQSLETINEAICKAAPGGGSTLVGAVVSGTQLFFCSVGDSRLYIFRGGEMICATRAHNYGFLLEERLRLGQISPEEYQQELPRAEALVSYFGAPVLQFADISRTPIALQQDDIILLCSDGLYRSIPEPRLQRIVCGYTGSFGTLAKYLTDTAERLCAQRDNTSLILLQVRACQAEAAAAK